MITIERWNEERWPNGELAIKASTFVRYNRKRVDPWFARYVQGLEPANYPMPAIQGQCFIEEWCIDIVTADKDAEYPVLKAWYRD